MYTVDGDDTVAELDDVPQSCTGAPLPMVISDEDRLILAYIVNEPDPTWDGTAPRSVSMQSEGLLIAVVEFDHAYAHLFGPPNDEAFHGHPLAKRGLKPYSAAEVLRSSWVRRLERMNSVHPYHSPELFDSYRHFVFAFHDSTFECVAEDLAVSLRRGSMKQVLEEVVAEWNS